MNEVRIITNNIPRDLLLWCELTESEQSELDYIDNPDERGLDFFRYKGQVYDTHEFMVVRAYIEPCVTPLKEWDGYSSDSFFSGIVIKYPYDKYSGYDYEHIIVGTYLS